MVKRRVQHSEHRIDGIDLGLRAEAQQRVRVREQLANGLAVRRGSRRTNVNVAEPERAVARCGAGVRERDVERQRDGVAAKPTRRGARRVDGIRVECARCAALRQIGLDVGKSAPDLLLAKGGRQQAR